MDNELQNQQIRIHLPLLLVDLVRKWQAFVNKVIVKHRQLHPCLQLHLFDWHSLFFITWRFGKVHYSAANLFKVVTSREKCHRATATAIRKCVGRWWKNTMSEQTSFWPERINEKFIYSYLGFVQSLLLEWYSNYGKRFKSSDCACMYA